MKVAKGLILKILITGKTNFVTIYRWILTRVFVVILPNVQILNNYAICVCELVAQSCPTLCYPVDYSLPGSSVHGFSMQEYWSGFPFPSPGDLPNTGTERGLLHCKQILYHLSQQGSSYYAMYLKIMLHGNTPQ